ncbi:MAG: HAD-IA family hydrolase [Oscillospiraceae bacterium]|nr:HAD-IA family hydrolase [Oscillospiraceae bacterium]
MYSPIIFDLDGTLLNTLGDLAAAGNHALCELGFPVHEKNSYKLFVGNGIQKLVERILPAGFSESEFNEAYLLFCEYYAVHSADKTLPYDGISELLDELCAKNITCLCNTNKSYEFAEVLLKRFFGNRITEIIGGEHGYPKKPAPDAARYLAEKYKTEGCLPLYVGDSSVDMQTAQNAGLDACGVLWGFRTRGELSQFKPKFLVENVNELKCVIMNGKN